MLSLLNPLFHPRIYYKEALTLAAEGYTVAIVGQPMTPPHPAGSNIRLCALPRVDQAAGSRIARLRVQEQAWQWLQQLRPRVLHVHTPELLPLALAWQARAGGRLVYDMHEDYYRNALSQQPGWQGRLRANAVRGLERSALGRLDAVIYAEAGFGDLLAAGEARSFWLQNKFRPHAALPAPPAALPGPGSSPRPLRLVHTGTLAPEWGIFRALALAAKLREDRPVTLTYAGFAPRSQPLAQLQRAIQRQKAESWVSIQGGARHLSYPTLLQALAGADISLALYHPLQRFEDRLPTKFFEAIYYNKPLIFTNLGPWQAWHEAWPLGYPWSGEPTAGAVEGLLQTVDAGWPALQQRSLPAYAYDWRIREAPALLKLYRQLIGSGSGGAPALAGGAQ
jgi:glycosyltransferase involved in cell wall biosynthesis